MKEVNIRPKQFTKVISLRLNKQEYDLFLKKFKKRKEDKISVNLKSYLFSKIKEDAIEYSIKQVGEYIAVTLHREGQEDELLHYENIDEAMKFVRKIGAEKKKRR